MQQKICIIYAFTQLLYIVEQFGVENLIALLIGVTIFKKLILELLLYIIFYLIIWKTQMDAFLNVIIYLLF